jgi:hypothetical protein
MAKKEKKNDNSEGGLKIEKSLDDVTMAEMLKLERIAKIESKISAEDEHTIRSLKEWIKDDKKPKKKK